MNANIMVTPKGERLAIMPAQEYEDMRDALIHAQAVADLRAGRDEAVTIDEMQTLLDAPSPLSFWREKRRMTRAAVAKAANLRASDIEALELGSRAGSAEIMAKIAAALKIGVEELL